MTNKFKHSASIEHFLANELAPLERAAFKKELKSNPELAMEMKLSETIDSALMSDEIIDLRQKLIRAIVAGHEVKEQEVPGSVRGCRYFIFANKP
jgi:hypothetical protein